MKTLLLMLSLLTSLSAYPAEGSKYCSILNPQVNDQNLNYCKSPKYGITHEDRLISKECYGTFEEAVKVMHKTLSCKLSPEIGNCRILHAGAFDKGQVFCPKGLYGVTYSGHLMSRYSCYPTLEKALSEMHRSVSCLQRSKHPAFKILPPNTLDRLYQSCPKFNFGVAYKEVLINKTCYDSVEKAFKAMEGHIKNF